MNLEPLWTLDSGLFETLDFLQFSPRDSVLITEEPT